MIGYENVGTIDIPSWTVNSNFVSGIGDVGYDSTPALADLDNDGDYDLLIGNIDGNMNGYENVGTINNPSWIENSNFVSGISDVGYHSIPALADLDNDGDYDLLIGEYEGVMNGYENVGTVYSPSWNQNSSFVTGIGNVGYHSAPALADLDNDGDYDLLIGEYEGVMNGYENVGTVYSPSWNQNSSFVTGIGNVGYHSAPALADLDNDGDYDLLIGEYEGVMNGYENVGTVYSPSWNQNSSFVTGIGEVGNWAQPALADLDNDGDYDLLIGVSNGTTIGYENMCE